jgi:hypothetical protein
MPRNPSREQVCAVLASEVSQFRKDLGEQARDLCVRERQQPLSGIDEGHFDSECREDRRVLASDRTSADDDQVREGPINLEHGLRVVNIGIVERDPRRMERAGPGRDEHPPAAERSLVPALGRHVDGPVGAELRLPIDQLDAVVLDVPPQCFVISLMTSPVRLLISDTVASGSSVRLSPYTSRCLKPVT